jgi:hypothetical protein
MEQKLKQYWPVLLLGGALLLILALNIRPYGWNPTAVFHMDHRLGDPNGLPKNFVVLEVPSYDGAQYYQIARNIPKVLRPSQWNALTVNPPGSYAYQRFLLPLTAFVASLGNDAALPYAFIAINFLALLLTCALFLQWKRLPLFALALCLSPTAMVAWHFSLAEPLTLLLLVCVLSRYLTKGRLRTSDVLALSLVVLAREVNILFVLFLIGFFALKGKWHDVLLLIVPIGAFLALHGLIFGIFAELPFFLSTSARQIPGSAALKLILGERGYDQKTLSAIALFCLFVLPATIWLLVDVIKRKKLELLPVGSLAFLALMLVMPDYIWGGVTSIGRVITPVYPLFLMHCAEKNTLVAKYFGAAILVLGLATAFGLAASVHPYTIV